MKPLHKLLTLLGTLACSVLLLPAQMLENNLKTLSNFYHVPDQASYRLSKVIGVFGNQDIEFEYNAHNDITRCSYFETDTITGQRSSGLYLDYLYNDKHQCIQKVEYGERAGFPELVIARRFCYKYNDKGQMTHFVRWNNLNTNPADTSLVEDYKLDIEYTAEGLPSKGVVHFVDPNSFEWYEGFTTTLEYNEKGQLYKRTAVNADGTPFESEEITFDSEGKYMILLSYLKQGTELIEWTFDYDKDGNVSALGSEGFIYQFSFMTSQPASKSYYPLPTLADLFLYGFKNYTIETLSYPLLYNGSKDAVATDATNGGTFVYETSKPLGLEPLATPSQSHLVCDDMSWTITNATTAVALYDFQGQCLQVIAPLEGVVTIKTATLPVGTYLIKAGSQTFKVIR